jgi:hypothetical protein
MAGGRRLSLRSKRHWQAIPDLSSSAQTYVPAHNEIRAETGAPSASASASRHTVTVIVTVTPAFMRPRVIISAGRYAMLLAQCGAVDRPAIGD